MCCITTGASSLLSGVHVQLQVQMVLFVHKRESRNTHSQHQLKRLDHRKGTTTARSESRRLVPLSLERRDVPPPELHPPCVRPTGDAIAETDLVQQELAGVTSTAIVGATSPLWKVATNCSTKFSSRSMPPGPKLRELHRPPRH